MSNLNAKEYKTFEESKKKGEIEQEALYRHGDWLADEAYEINQLEQLLYSSFVVSTFMFMEKSLYQFCDFIFRAENEDFGFRDLKGNGISRALFYLSKKIDNQFPKDDKLKIDLNISQKIRNIIAHNDGLVNEILKKELIKSIQQGLPIKINKQHNQIELTYEYALWLIELNKRVGEEIIKHWKVKNS